LGHSTGPLYINIVKMYHQSDYKTFDVFGRVISGTIKRGESVKIMGENY
jgi:U5 small nuclear ribonucleoprotein component